MTAAFPPDYVSTARERLRKALSGGPATARDLSQLVGLSEREVVAHLQHLQRSLYTQNQRLVVIPASCRDCGFIFKKRERLTNSLLDNQ